MNRSKSRGSIYDGQVSATSSPAKINYKAVDKFIHRQELARWLKKEQEMYEQQLRSGSKVRWDKQIDDQKRMLLREISLPSNEDFSYFSHDASEEKNHKIDKQAFEYDEDKNLKDISNFIDRVFNPLDQWRIVSQHSEESDSLDVIQEQLFEETNTTFPIKTADQKVNESNHEESEQSEQDDEFLPNKVQIIDPVNINKKEQNYKVDYYKSDQVYSDKQYKAARESLKEMLYSIQF